MQYKLRIKKKRSGYSDLGNPVSTNTFCCGSDLSWQGESEIVMKIASYIFLVLCPDNGQDCHDNLRDKALSG